MTTVLISRELLFATLVHDTAAHAGVDVVRIDDPSQLPEATSVRMVLVDWGDRAEAWGPLLSRWLASAPAERRPRIILFGPHTDLRAHAAASGAGLGPMWARSRLVRALPELL